MARTIQAERGSKKRNTKKIILIGTEGENKTEKLYFSALLSEFNNVYSIKFAEGNETDPESIVENTKKASEKYCTDEGDIALAIFDTDVEQSKQSQVDSAITQAYKSNIQVIMSAPCFEIWFLLHFRYSTHQYYSSDEAVDELKKKYIDTYNKNLQVYDMLRGNQEIAIENAKKLEKYHNDLGLREKDVKRNPSTEVYKLIEYIRAQNKIE